MPKHESEQQSEPAEHYLTKAAGRLNHLQHAGWFGGWPFGLYPDNWIDGRAVAAMTLALEWFFGALAVLLVAIMLCGLYLILRRRLIAREGGTFELAMRRAGSPAERGWHLGLGRCQGECLEWFPVFSADPRPKGKWLRHQLAIAGQRDPRGLELEALYADSVVVKCTSTQGELEFAMSTNSLTGFSSWLEAGPPGTPRQH